MAAAVIALRKKKAEDAARFKAEVKSVFDRFDTDSSGDIDASELLQAAELLGLSLHASEVTKLLQFFGGENAKTLNREQFNRFVAKLRARQSQQEAELCSGWGSHLPLWRGHEKAKKIYMNNVMQLLVAACILGNFVVNIAEKEIDPYPAHMQKLGEVWQAFDLAFNIIFTFEIVLNAWSCGGPYRKFWSSGWNCFDFTVVFVGLVMLSGLIHPSNPLSNLKMLRAFRVFRLFKRIKSLNKVVMALVKSIPGVMNAFIIMVIFMMIYAILAVEYFAHIGQDFGPDPNATYTYGVYTTFGEGADGNLTEHQLDAGTDRGFVYGWEYYGTFCRALFTLFQVMTGESWSEAIARPIMFSTRNAIPTAFFFVSFILLMQIVLTNVVVAVLLEKFVEDPGTDQKEDEPPVSVVPTSSLYGADGEEPGSTPAPSDTKTSAPEEALASTNNVPVDARSNNSVASAQSTRAMNEKLSLILSELQTLKTAVQRCEQGLDGMRAGVNNPQGTPSRARPQPILEVASSTGAGGADVPLTERLQGFFSAQKSAADVTA